MSNENPSLVPEAACLYVVGTPIGNLADLSERAISILSKVDCVACEDTRVTGLLFSRIGIKRPLIPYHDKNEANATNGLIQRLKSGESVAIVSDAGTPAVSDPGFRIVRECRRQGITVVPVPGPCAFTTLLSASGLPTDSFLYMGFLPPKSAARIRFLEKHKDYKRTIALYESCHRIEKFMNEMEKTLGPDRVICIGRELTKKFETIHSGKIVDIRPQFDQGSKKGEFVVLIAPANYEL
ncbi:16S rRNA (cytidine(1402)-2'-O)-methyltransferase [Puniceicoccaceae bacterium K14]|nr:16S rRNA (cytidine(1402)-2'-O)-methyltransferase [Puniceicoccaceae bacterium K14]